MAKIVAFGASNSSDSINKQLATYAASQFDGHEIEVLDLNDFEVAIYSKDRERATGIPTLIHKFLGIISQCNMLIISFAENNGSYTTAFKNILDWGSRAEPKTFYHKPTILFATSPGPKGGRFVLEAAKTRLPFHDAEVIGHFSLPEFAKNFDNQKGILDSELKENFDKVIQIAKERLLASNE